MLPPPRALVLSFGACEPLARSPEEALSSSRCIVGRSDDGPEPIWPKSLSESSQRAATTPPNWPIAELLGRKTKARTAILGIAQESRAGRQRRRRPLRVSALEAGRALQVRCVRVVWTGLQVSRGLALSLPDRRANHEKVSRLQNPAHHPGREHFGNTALGPWSGNVPFLFTEVHPTGLS